MSCWSNFRTIYFRALQFAPQARANLVALFNTPSMMWKIFITILANYNLDIARENPLISYNRTTKLMLKREKIKGITSYIFELTNALVISRKFKEKTKECIQSLFIIHSTMKMQLTEVFLAIQERLNSHYLFQKL